MSFQNIHAETYMKEKLNSAKQVIKYISFRNINILQKEKGRDNGHGAQPRKNSKTKSNIANLQCNALRNCKKMLFF